MRSKSDGNSGDLENTYDGPRHCAFLLLGCNPAANLGDLEFMSQTCLGKKSEQISPMFAVTFLKERCCYKYISKIIWEGQFRKMCLLLSWTTRRRMVKRNEDGESDRQLVSTPIRVSLSPPAVPTSLEWLCPKCINAAYSAAPVCRVFSFSLFVCESV